MDGASYWNGRPVAIPALLSRVTREHAEVPMVTPALPSNPSSTSSSGSWQCRGRTACWSSGGSWGSAPGGSCSSFNVLTLGQNIKEQQRTNIIYWSWNWREKTIIKQIDVQWLDFSTLLLYPSSGLDSGVSRGMSGPWLTSWCHWLLQAAGRLVIELIPEFFGKLQP